MKLCNCGCGKEVNSWCQYLPGHHIGNGRGKRRTGDIITKFLSYLQPPNANGCRIWTGGVSREYGRFYTKNPHGFTYAHEFAYIIEYGKEPESIHHICEVKLCCEPTHLQDLGWTEHMSYHISKKGGIRRR